VPSLRGPAVPAGRLAQLVQPVLELGGPGLGGPGLGGPGLGGLDPGGLVLRPWRPADAAAVVAAYADPGIQRWHVRSMTVAEAGAWISAWPHRWNTETGAGWAVAGPAGVLGQISLRRVDLAEGLGELSYWVLPAARGQRVATRALGTLTDWAFGPLGLHRLELAHSTLNEASCGVARNAGYLLEGTKRQEVLHTDGWHDMHLHARLAAGPRPAAEA
jgi:RimJ/RimL family protein N-acetyltransferase